MSVFHIESQFLELLDFKRALTDGTVASDDAGLSDTPSWDPQEGQTYDAYKITRYVDNVPIDMSDDSYRLVIDKVRPGLVMYRQLVVPADPAETPFAMCCVAVPLGESNHVSLSVIEGTVFLDILTYQDGNIYGTSAGTYDADFSIWDVRYGDESKDREAEFDMEGNVYHGMENTVLMTKDGEVKRGTRGVLLYGSYTIDNHQFIDKYSGKDGESALWGLSVFGHGDGLSLLGENLVYFDERELTGLIFSYMDDDGNITVSGICYNDYEAAVFSQEYGPKYRNEYPAVEKVECDNEFYRFFELCDGDDRKEVTPLGVGANT